MTETGLREEMLTYEPLRMVNVRQQPCTPDAAPEMAVQTLELSSLDHLYDYYNSVALFYHVEDVGFTSQPMGQPAGGGSPLRPANAAACNGASGLASVTTNHCSSDDPAVKLQSALEELLLHYPAVAGRLHINETTGRFEVKYKPTSSSSSCCTASMDTNGEEGATFGVPFMVARANTTFAMLGDVTVPHPSLDVLYPSAPKRNCNNEPPAPVALMQVTTFTCGSFTLAFMSSHMLTDAYATAILLQNLCSIARGMGLVAVMDTTNRRDVLKAREPPSPNVAWHPHICTTKKGDKNELPYGVATRFPFNAGTLENLRLRASHPNAKARSRFQALVAFLWVTRAKCLANAGSSPSMELPLRFPINIRGRESFEIPEGYMGNAVFQCTVFATIQELCESSYVDVVSMIASAIVRGIHIQKHAQSEIDYMELQLRNGRVPLMDHACLGMPSLVNLPFYDADCGWGRPIYCGRPSRQLGQRMIILDDPRSKCWNVLVVLTTPEEKKIFREEIAALTTAS